MSTSSSTGSWPAGSVFAVGWLILFVPIFLISMFWFWRRRTIQPIKARSPVLVIITDSILLLYTLSLCLQRIIVDDYPCLLNVWGSYAGTVILLNSYMWRCWTLYFNFNLTAVRLASVKEIDPNNFFIKNRHLTTAEFAVKVAEPALRDETGDNCRQKWGQSLLVAYVFAYVTCFAWFTFSLRSVVDGFKIKTELKITGFIALMAVIPWIMFNQLAAKLNTDTFPFSTLFLLIAIVAAVSASTIYPLYASIFVLTQPITSASATSFHPIGSHPHTGPSEFHPDRLYKILSSPSGLESFKQFLTKEFSVENIVFYEEIEMFRKEIRRAMESQETEAPLKFVMEARKIYAKYIAVGSPYQVNLPDPVVRNCESHLKYEGHVHGAVPQSIKSTSNAPVGTYKLASPTTAAAAASSSSSSSPPLASIELSDWSSPPPPLQPPLDHLAQTTPTLFDDCQRTIYNLMEKDSMLRFIRSDLYKHWFEAMQEERHKNAVLEEMNLV